MNSTVTEDTNIQTDYEHVIVADGLKKYFPVKSGFFNRDVKYVKAVDNLNFKIKKGEMYGLVGESGCGKTTTGRLLVKSIPVTDGKIYFKGQDITELKEDDREFRQSIQMIFQDPYEAINPRMTVFNVISEPLQVHSIGSIDQREKRVARMLDKVGLVPPESFLFRYPHELSGGQRQRVAIARAMIIEPDFIVADEPTSMLDVSIRTQIMRLMTNLQKEINVSYLYITHDLAVARYLCSDIGVMYLGKLVETGDTEKVTQNPLHPYTKALISAVPVPDPTYERERIKIKGGISKPIDPPPRCRFYDRCLERDEECKAKAAPELKEVEEDHYVACYHV